MINSPSRTRLPPWIALLAVVAASAILWLTLRGRSRPVAGVLLSDGRILHFERVFYGTHDRIGQRDYFSRYFSWLPFDLDRFLAPEKGESTLDLPEPALVLWVDATDAKTGRNADAQRMRMEFVDRHGELWGEATYHCDGFQGTYSRIAWVFTSFPRDEPTLTLRCVPWNNNQPSQLEITNPCFTAPAVWAGLPLPQRQAAAGLEIVLTRLALATNGTPKEFWTTPARYWNPSWQLLRAGLPAVDWDAPEWEAQDPLGNRGTIPNIDQPVLRFSATFYPSATNLEATVLVATLPQIDLTSSATNLWNITHRFLSHEIDALGFFPPGTCVFSRGQMTDNNFGLGPLVGGAPSGWVGTSIFVGLGRRVAYDGHYTPYPVIYLRYNEDPPNGRIALRLRDLQGACWSATPEPSGDEEGVHPFMVPPPRGIKIVTPEIVCLKPVKATFLVATPPPPQ